MTASVRSLGFRPMTRVQENLDRPKIRDTIFVHANSSGWRGDLQPFLCLGAGAAGACDDGFDRIPRLFEAFWPRLHRPHHQVGASEGENAALVIMTLLA